MKAIGNDITERKRVEEALRRSEERWQLAATGTTDGIWDWDVAGHTVFLSARWKQLRGYREEEIGVDETEWSSRIHPEDSPGVMATLQSYFNKEIPAFHCEYRTRRKDGTYFWISDRGIAVWDAQGRVVRMVGSETDITERKRAELALQQSHLLLNEQREELQVLTDKLLMAQDAERQRIARDLHDDFSQRLVAVALDLEDFGRNPPPLPDAFSRALEPVREQLAQLSDDLRNLAHRLHPSLLEHVGLQAALDEHVHQAMKRSGLDITLKVRDVPDSLCIDVATCLFRVFQECLQNVVKHAHATEVLVKLSGSSKGIGLSVTDNGIGFAHQDKSHHQKGLGLTSMRERLRLLNGFLNIHSRPAEGSKVCAWIPSQEQTP